MNFQDITEADFSTIYPKAFIAFRDKYLKRSRDRKLNELWVQFSNYADNTLDKRAWQNPNHDDPVGIYAYPMAYVLSHPADIWYGSTARYLRVLRAKPKNALVMQTIDETRCRMLLRAMGFPEVDNLIYDIAQAHKNRLKGRNHWAKLFLACVQFQHTTRTEFTNRTGQEQSKLFMRAGFDMLMDRARSDTAAVMNAREPEQACFLTRGAFEIIEIVNLRKDVTDKLHTTNPGPESNVRKIAATIAAAMDDKLEPKTDTKVPYDVQYEFAGRYWTKLGRQFTINIERHASYYKNKEMGQKKHREVTTFDSYIMTIEVETEYGNFRIRGDMEFTLDEIATEVRTKFNELKNNPRKDDYVARTRNQSIEHMRKMKDAKGAEQANKRIQEKANEIDKMRPTFDWLLKYFRLPMDFPFVTAIDKCQLYDYMFTYIYGAARQFQNDANGKRQRPSARLKDTLEDMEKTQFVMDLKPGQFEFIARLWTAIAKKADEVSNEFDVWHQSHYLLQWIKEKIDKQEQTS